MNTVQMSINFRLDNYVVPAGYSVVESSSGSVQTVSLMSMAGEKQEAVYEVVVRSVDNAYLAENNCKHLDVWRTCKAEHEAVLTPFARAIFACIAAQCTIWVSDEQQRADVRQFWRYRLHESVVMPNLDVFYIDTGSQERPTVELVKDAEALSDIYFPKSWGTDAERLGKGFIIAPAN